MSEGRRRRRQPRRIWRERLGDGRPFLPCRPFVRCRPFDLCRPFVLVCGLRVLVDESCECVIILIIREFEDDWSAGGRRRGARLCATLGAVSDGARHDAERKERLSNTHTHTHTHTRMREACVSSGVRVEVSDRRRRETGTEARDWDGGARSLTVATTARSLLPPTSRPASTPAPSHERV